MNVVMFYDLSGRAGGSGQEDTGVSVEEWNAMTPAGRAQVVDDTLALVVTYGFGPADRSETIVSDVLA